MSGRRPLAVAAAATVLLAAAPSALAAPSSWRGWTSAGPAPSPGYVAGIDATADTTLTVGRPQNGDVVPFLVESPAGVRTGAVSAGADPPGRFPTNGSAPPARPVVLGGGRLLVARGCEIRRSDDGGATWTVASPSGCAAVSLSLSFADRGHGFLVGGRAAWTTADGGATWTPRATAAPGAREPSLPVEVLALSATVALRTIDDPVPGPDGTPVPRLQRTDDGGTSWADVAVPETDVATVRPTVRVRGYGRPVLRADRTVLVPAGSSVLRSADGGRGFVAHRVPSLIATLRTTETAVDGIACDPATRCVVDVLGGQGTLGAVRFDGTAFGAELPPLAPPRFPGDATEPVGTAVAPRDGTLLAVRGYTLGRSADGGASWSTSTPGYVRNDRRVGTPRAPAFLVDGVLTLSVDRGRTFRALPAPPGDGPVLRVLPAPSGPLALREDGTVARRVGGRWAVVARLGRLRPVDAALADGALLVASRTRIVRLEGRGSAPLRSRTVRLPPITGIGTITAVGRTAFAGAGNVSLRSADGGRTWRRGPTPDVSAAQVVGPRTVMALDGGRVLRSTDGGRRFRRVGRTAPFGTAGIARPAFPGPDGVAFSSARRGLVLTEDGLFRTTDAGRTLVPVPTPPQGRPDFVAPVGDGPGLLAEDGWSTTVYRSDGRTAVGRPPRIRLRAVGRPVPVPKDVAGRPGDRTQTVVGEVRGVPAGQRLLLAPQRSTASPPGDRGTVVDVRADGTFRARAELETDQGALRAWYAGAVLPDRTVAGARSPAVRMPRR